MATVIITGGTGMIGTALSKLLSERGYNIIILTRDKTPQSALPKVPNIQRSPAADRVPPEASAVAQGLPKGAGEHYYNRLIWMLPNGQYGHYDKRHRFAYAGEDQHYAAGNRRLIASVSGWNLNLQVCYDLRFPVWARQQTNDNSGMLSELPPHENKPASPEYDVLVYVANWPERRSHAWKTLLQARAIENQCYVIGLNRVGADGNNIYHSGDSMIVDPLGEVLYHKAHDEDVYTHSLSKDRLEEVRSKFPFWKDADEFRIMNHYEEKVQ